VLLPQSFNVLMAECERGHDMSWPSVAAGTESSITHQQRSKAAFIARALATFSQVRAHCTFGVARCLG
jgi:hypothetical protein